MPLFNAKRVSFISGLLAAMIVSACGSDPTAPGVKYVQVHFSVQIDGNASVFGGDSYVAIVDSSQAVPLVYGAADSLALLPGEHTLELRRTGTVADLAKRPACTSSVATPRVFIVNSSASNTLEFRFNCGAQEVPDCPTIFCLTPLPAVMLKITIVATGAHVPQTVRLILKTGIFFPRENTYVVNTNQTTEFTLERDFYQIGIDSPECPLPGGPFSALSSGLELISDASVSISLSCP